MQRKMTGPYARAAFIAAAIAAIVVLFGPSTPVSAQGNGNGGGTLGFGPAPVAPSFAAGFRVTLELPANAEPGDAVGDPVTATHPNSLAITYSLSGTDTGSFSVDAATGQIRLKEGVSLAVGDTFTVNLTATDSAKVGAIIIVDIEVTEAVYHPYDFNGNGMIDRDEIIEAVRDFYDGVISRAEIIAIARLYFDGAAV